MAIIKFSREETEQIVPRLQRYLRDQLDCEVGQFDAEFLLDFFAEEIGGFFYNRALTDVHALLASQIETMSDSIHELEKPVSLERK